jgi:purine-binding chemotaxis protein CheW
MQQPELESKWKKPAGHVEEAPLAGLLADLLEEWEEPELNASPWGSAQTGQLGVVADPVPEPAEAAVETSECLPATGGMDESASPLPALTLLGRLFEEDPEADVEPAAIETSAVEAAPDLDFRPEAAEEPAGPEPVAVEPVVEAVEAVRVEQPPIAAGAAESADDAGPEAAAIVAPAAAQLGEGERYVVFQLAGRQFALPLTSVVETERLPRITPLPGLPECIRGVFNLRGEILPLVDFRLLLGMAPNDLPREGRMLVVRSKRVPHPCAFAVDGLHGLAALRIEELARATPGEDDRIQPLLAGVGEHKEQPLPVFDLEKVFTGTELNELAA